MQVDCRKIHPMFKFGLYKVKHLVLEFQVEIKFSNFINVFAFNHHKTNVCLLLSFGTVFQKLVN